MGNAEGIVYKMRIPLCLTSPDFYVYDGQIGPDVTDGVDDVQAHRHIRRNQSAPRIYIPTYAFLVCEGSDLSLYALCAVCPFVTF